MGIDFYGAFKSGRRSSKLGEQSRGSDHKYSKDCAVPAVVAKPYAELRPVPDINPESGEMLPGVTKSGQISWIKFMYSVGFAGLSFPDPHDARRTIRNQASFWLIPTDIADVCAEALSSAGSVERKIELAIKNSPYSILFYRATESDAIPEAPREWAMLGDKQRWCHLLGVDSGKGIYEPLSWPEEHAIMRAQMISNGGKRDPIDGQSLVYQDGRSPGSVHPCVVEFGKSATKCIRQAIFNAGPDGDPNAKFLITGDMADPQSGQVFEMKAVRQKRDDGGEYNVHRLSLKGVSRPVTPQEIAGEWHPWKEQCAVGGSDRKPLLTLLSSREQLDLLIGVFGAELVSFAMKGTPYFNLLSDVDKAAYDRFVQASRQPGAESWVQLMYRRMAKSAELKRDAAQAPATQMQPPQTRAPSREEIDQLITNAQTPAETPGSFDSGTAAELFRDMGVKETDQKQPAEAPQENATAPQEGQTEAKAPQPTLDASSSLSAPESPSEAEDKQAAKAERPDDDPQKPPDKFWDGVSDEQIPW